MTSELIKLYNLLQAEYKPLTEDMAISGPTKDEPTDFVCCDQKIIIFHNDNYLISDLYDSHPTMLFETEREVLSFYKGYKDGSGLDFSDVESTAESIGTIISMSEIIKGQMNKPYWKKYISPRQIKYNKNKSND